MHVSHLASRLVSVTWHYYKAACRICSIGLPQRVCQHLSTCTNCSLFAGQAPCHALTSSQPITHKMSHPQCAHHHVSPYLEHVSPCAPCASPCFTICSPYFSIFPHVLTMIRHIVTMFTIRSPYFTMVHHIFTMVHHALNIVHPVSPYVQHVSPYFTMCSPYFTMCSPFFTMCSPYFTMCSPSFTICSPCLSLRHALTHVASVTQPALFRFHQFHHFSPFFTMFNHVLTIFSPCFHHVAVPSFFLSVLVFLRRTDHFSPYSLVLYYISQNFTLTPVLQH